jgi:hypothetical protein
MIQITSPGKKFYFNVDDTALKGALIITGNCYSFPIYLCQKGAMYDFILFDNESHVNEWLCTEANKYEKVQRVELVSGNIK